MGVKTSSLTGVAEDRFCGHADGGIADGIGISCLAMIREHGYGRLELLLRRLLQFLATDEFVLAASFTSRLEDIERSR